MKRKLLCVFATLAIMMYTAEFTHAQCSCNSDEGGMGWDSPEGREIVNGHKALFRGSGNIFPHKEGEEEVKNCQKENEDNPPAETPPIKFTKAYLFNNFIIGHKDSVEIMEARISNSFNSSIFVNFGLENQQINLTSVDAEEAALADNLRMVTVRPGLLFTPGKGKFLIGVDALLGLGNNGSMRNQTMRVGMQLGKLLFDNVANKIYLSSGLYLAKDIFNFHSAIPSLDVNSLSASRTSMIINPNLKFVRYINSYHYKERIKPGYFLGMELGYNINEGSTYSFSESNFTVTNSSSKIVFQPYVSFSMGVSFLSGVAKSPRVW